MLILQITKIQLTLGVVILRTPPTTTATTMTTMAQFKLGKSRDSSQRLTR